MLVLRVTAEPGFPHGGSGKHKRSHPCTRKHPHRNRPPKRLSATSSGRLAANFPQKRRSALSWRACGARTASPIRHRPNSGKALTPICTTVGSKPSCHEVATMWEAGKKRLNGDTQREANSDEVSGLRDENQQLKEVVADLLLKNRLLKKSLTGWESE